MLLLKLAWKNLWRNRSRTAVTLSAIFFAVILTIVMRSLQDGVFDHFVRNVVSFYSGYIQVHKSGYWDQQILDNGFERKDSLEKRLSAHKNVLAVAPRIESYALASVGNLTKGCLAVGILPEEEDRITQLKAKVTEGSYLSESDKGSVLVAEGLAERLGIHLHDTVILISQGYHGSMAAGKYRVTGLLKFGSPQLNDQLLYLPLAEALEFYGSGNVITSYVMALQSDDDLEQTASSLKAVAGDRYEVMTWKEMLPEIDQHIKTDKGSMYIISGVLYLLIGFGIFGTLLMMMAERRYELGMLVAIGMKKSKLIAILLAESVLNVLVGCLCGIIASVPIVLYLEHYPIRFSGNMADIYERFGFEPIFPAVTNVWIFVTQAVVVLIMGLLLSLYPIVKVLRMDPVTAMKK